MNLQPWQWAVAAIGALMVGLSKTGIPGLSLLFVAIFANVLPTKQASGIVLPLLIVGDLVAVASYRRHAQWGHLWRLFPWTAAGVVIGYAAMAHLGDRQIRVMVGAMILGMVGLHLARRRGRVAADGGAHPWWFGPAIGILAGFATLVANAAGPLMVIYLLAMRLPKLEYVGTGAVFFMLLNLFKIPFMAGLGLVTPASLELNLVLAPLVVAGGLAGRKVLARIDQKHFENLMLGLTVAAGLKLLF